jgi:hypothetical protein
MFKEAILGENGKYSSLQLGIWAKSDSSNVLRGGLSQSCGCWNRGSTINAGAFPTIQVK